MSDRTSTKYGKLVGRKDDEFYFLDDIFNYGDGFKGATGTRLRLVPQEEYAERTSQESKEEYARGFWQTAVADGKTDDGLTDWMEYNDIGDDFMFDLSYAEYWPQLRTVGYSEEEYPIIECTGGGRCFDSDMEFDEVYAPELIKLINKVEAR